MNASSPSSDRNLLFGILALQMDFIDRDQLVAAMNAWVVSKTEPLEQILVTQGSLNDEEMSLLLALVEKYVEKHGNSPEQSLAGVSSVASSVRDELSGIQDGDLSVSLSHVASNVVVETDFADTKSLRGSKSDGQRFRVLRPHAKGGLGEVFVASDNELPREVALKQIREERADDPDSRSRFMIEAELTGGLEHPGIVPVYGLGQYGNGRPFYAMRFIRGDSLKEAIKRFHDDCRKGTSFGERSLRLRKLLGRYIDVCDAIEYAHSRGVLHRDLKPGNVMLGKHGETLVVDWGLAKAIGDIPDRERSDEVVLAPRSGSGSARTEMGKAVGTPAFMSPEQAAGRLDLLGPASDVYSLGATLYALLTGRHPFSGKDTAAVLQKVQRGEFRAPREIASHVPPSLEAICLKAMAVAPEARYASPRLLADDIEHWLADEPVSAYRDPVLSRIARWARRHKVAVALVTMLMLTALVSLSVGAVLLTNANRRTHAAWQVAEKNEQIANDNFRLARKAVDDYLTTVSQETLFEEPGMQPLRRKLLAEALDFYRRFVQQRTDDPELQEMLRDAQFRVGTITNLIGSHKESLAAFTRALEINQQLMQRNPLDGRLQFKSAECRIELAAQLREAGRVEDALKHFELAIQLLTRLAEHSPEDALVRARLCTTYSNLGAMKQDQHLFDEAQHLYRLALEIASQLAKETDTDGEHRGQYAGIQHNLALLSSETGDYEQAIEYYLAAIEIREQLVGDFPRNQVYQTKLATSCDSLANTFSKLGRLSEAIPIHQRASEIRERLVRENPAVTAYHDQLAGSYSNLASKYRQLGDIVQSSDLGQRAVTIWQRLAADHADVLDYRENLATGFYNLGNLQLGDPAADSASMDDETMKRKASASIPHYQAAIEVFESLLTQLPDVPRYQVTLAKVYNNCSSAYHLCGDKELSHEMIQKVVDLREQLVANHPEVPEYRNLLAGAYANIAGDETDPNKMFEFLNKSVALRQTLVDDFPDVPEYRYRLALSLQIVALRHFMSGNQTEALPAFRRIILLMEALYKEFPTVPNYRKMLVNAINLCAAGQRLSGDWKEAAQTEGKKIAIFEPLLAQDPHQIEYITGLAGGIEGVAKCYHKGEDYKQALTGYEKALQVLEPAIQREGSDRSLVSATVRILTYRLDVLQTLERHEEAIQDLARIIKLAPDSLAWQVKRARLRALIGQHAEGTAEASELLAGDEELSKGELYNMACVFSLAFAAVRADSSLSQDRQNALAVEYAQKAVDCLDKARAAGYFTSEEEIDHMAKDSDFERLRTEPTFVTFQKSLSAPRTTPAGADRQDDAGATKEPLEEPETPSVPPKSRP